MLRAKSLFYVAYLHFGTYYGYFLAYMLFAYNKVRKLGAVYTVKAVPKEVILKIIATSDSSHLDDSINTVVINKNILNELGVGDYVVIAKRGASRPVQIIGADVDVDAALLSYELLFNFSNAEKIKLKPSESVIKATEIDISLVNTHHDLPHALVDCLAKNYFQTPKFARQNDVIAVDFEKYAPEYFYTQYKWNGVRTVHFKCNKVSCGTKSVTTAALCKVGDTALKQSTNVQAYLAPNLKSAVDFGADLAGCAVEKCPYGLEEVFEKLEKAVKPFLSNKGLPLAPVFLLRGSRGCGKEALADALAAKIGLHLFRLTAGDVNAAVYAQTEAKMRNVFFKAKLCSPCIVAIANFENFARNNEGQHDERIMSYFRDELKNLFANNNFPIVLICMSNGKEIPTGLSRAFLEVFDVPTPDSVHRCRLLKWILLSKQITFKDVEEVAEKAHGLNLEDLKALVYYAQKEAQGCDIDKNSFYKALDVMQAKYSQSLGAPKVPTVQWEDVGGLAEVKEEIVRTITLPLKHPDLLRSTGLKRSGVLLYGPPGTGKTLMAKAVATECNLCFLSVKGPELLNMYVGQSEQNIREVFQRARDASPCIIFFDELDSLAPNRGVSGDSGGVMDRVVSQLLAEMDGLDQGATIFIIGATNRPDLIDPALLRPGRFDKLLYVGPCTDFQSKLGVLKALTRKFKFANCDLKKVVKMCPENVTGADFYGLCSNAWMSAVKRVIANVENGSVKDATHDNVAVTMEDFEAALKELRPSIRAEELLYFQKLQQQLGMKRRL